jgi:hypothetical protein
MFVLFVLFPLFQSKECRNVPGVRRLSAMGFFRPNSVFAGLTLMSAGTDSIYEILTN